MQKGIYRIAGVNSKKKGTVVVNVSTGGSKLFEQKTVKGYGYLRVTRFRSLPSSSTSIGSGETWMTLIF